MDIFSKFEWHSSCSLDDGFETTRQVIKRMANTKKNLGYFYTAGDNFLIHKSKKALWKISDDGRAIEPVFDTDVLDESDVSGEK